MLSIMTWVAKHGMGMSVLTVGLLTEAGENGGMEGRLPGLQRHQPAPLCPSLLSPAHLLEAAGSACSVRPVGDLAVEV